MFKYPRDVSHVQDITAFSHLLFHTVLELTFEHCYVYVFQLPTEIPHTAVLGSLPVLRSAQCMN